jgi:hypothetical protein
MASSGRTLEEEISYLLARTTNFSESFAIKVARVRNWRLLAIVTTWQADGEILASDLRKKIKPLVPRGRDTTNLQPWLTRYVHEFKNDNGPFLDRILATVPGQSQTSKNIPSNGPPKRARMPNTKAFRLSKSFYDAAQNYSKIIFEGHGYTLANPELITEEVSRAIMKELFDFQTKYYYDPWKKFVSGLSSIADKNGGNPKLFDLETIGLVHWVIFLLFSRLKMTEPAKWWDSIDINEKTTEVMKVTDPDELVRARNFLSGKKSGQMLLRKKEDTKWYYKISDGCFDVATKYVETTAAFRPEWHNRLRQLLAEYNIAYTLQRFLGADGRT